MATKLRVDVLDDYIGAAEASADWSRLEQRCDVHFHRDHLADRDALARRLADAAIVVVERERTPFRAELLDALPNLRLLVTTGPVNWSIDYDRARERGVIVCGTEARQDLAPEHTMALILALARRVVVEDRAIREGRWTSGIGMSVRRKKLGIIGLGQAGRTVAAMAATFGMELLAWSANLTEEAASASGAKLVSRDELLARSDIVTLHSVLSDRTRHLIDADALALMKRSAFLVNTSRGPLVVEKALIEALSCRQIAGAAIDVFDVEPLPAGHPLLALDNVILTPHIGYLTQEQASLFYGQVVEDIEAFLAGRPIRELGPP